MKAVIKTRLRRRMQDRWGLGHFGAPRGDRAHNGQDYCCPPGSDVLSPVDGLITKLGYPYSDDASFRYVQITDLAGRDHRIFYVEPCVWVGQRIHDGDSIGQSQDLNDRYPEISQHIHYEIRYKGEFLDPEEFLHEQRD